jgi:hypothetical protein
MWKMLIVEITSFASLVLLYIFLANIQNT